jgi:hypothetical protein
MWAIVVYGLTIFAVLGVGAVLIFGNNSPAKPASPGPTPTVTTTR